MLPPSFGFIQSARVVLPADRTPRYRRDYRHGPRIRQTGDTIALQRPKTGLPIPKEADIPLNKLRQRIVLHHIGKIDPSDITDTIAAGEYQAWAKALSMTLE